YLLGQQLGNIETALTMSAKADLAQIEKGSKIASYLSEGVPAVGRFVLKHLVLRPLASREEGAVDRKTARLLAGFCSEAWAAFDRQLDPSGDRKRRLDSGYLSSLLAFYTRMSDGWLSVARHETEPIDTAQIISATEDALAAQSEVAHVGLGKLEAQKSARLESEAAVSEFNKTPQESVVANRPKESNAIERQNFDVSRSTSHSESEARGTEAAQVSHELNLVRNRSIEGKGLGEFDIAAPTTKSIDQVLLSLRTEATRITRKLAEQEEGLGQTTSPTLFGDINHAVFRTLGKQAVEEGLLPSTMMFAPAPIRITGGRLSRGRTIDAWDSATSIGWD